MIKKEHMVGNQFLADSIGKFDLSCFDDSFFTDVRRLQKSAKVVELIDVIKASLGAVNVESSVNGDSSNGITSYEYTIDIPGTNPSDIKLTVDDATRTMRVNVGARSSKFDVNEAVDMETVKAKYVQGRLTISMQTKKASKPGVIREIKVST